MTLFQTSPFDNDAFSIAAARRYIGRQRQQRDINRLLRTGAVGAYIAAVRARDTQVADYGRPTRSPRSQSRKEM